MMAEGSNNVQDREKVTKKKSRKTLSKKDAHNSPEHKVAKRSPKKARSRKDIHSPSDTIRQSQPQKCLQQTHRSSSCLKERNVVAQPGNNQPGWNYSIKTPSKIHQVTMREPIQVDLLKDRPQVPERKKKSEVEIPRRIRLQSSVTSRIGRTAVSMQPKTRNITQPLQSRDVGTQATSRTTSKAEVPIIEMAQKSRLSTSHVHQNGLSALVTERSFKKGILKVGKKSDTGGNNNAQPAHSEVMNNLREEQSGFATTEVSESTEPRLIMPKKVVLFQDWRLGTLKGPDRPAGDHWQKAESHEGSLLQVENQKHQDRRFPQKKAIMTEQGMSVRHLEGLIDGDRAKTSPLSSKVGSQSIANYPIFEEVEESARGYANFLYRPGAGWLNVGSETMSSRSSGPSEKGIKPQSCEANKSTSEIVLAVSSANARRQEMRKALIQRLGGEMQRKKFLDSKNCADSKHSQCRCC
ncbi:uncharacterized protein [Physcomitrium patens]|nr:uncharacterized protein LOC112285807 isoform X4 [Physcomitrium patens]XP_024382764.1 uncharacterized protein LOC112285807 isoform X4 [Physcomitrium patens]XP_024382765.1 uncharacterized protein LOC112285807 isoform X4 [Physcomitrium patens]XP_024382766.1 uncharacterized protein LOC112285807 isoform X4 [Physcomitrium patens]XP_024382767.1 uncharacterized protein LOC112285807 isoform X4 [Physcomitrium patens]XP_024382768.1 uncharacterized protein LOC112285807 isoform X4 [Physcomitrium patens]|eukprot:XP_024382762.1 uncharacterized protein LOC112285807 isoform X4 [Physcomitrella patens]